MIDLKLYYGRVVDNEDPDEKSKVKVRLLPEMKDAQEDHLPWLKPFMVNNMTSGAYSHSPLEIGSTVWAFFTSDSFQTGWYITASYLEDLFDWNDVAEDLNSITEGDNQEYPQARFIRYKDGTIVFHNTETGETGTYHNTGTYVFIDKEGSVFVKSVKDIKFYNDNSSMEVKEDGTIELSNDSGSGNTFTVNGSTFEFNGNLKSLVKFEDLKNVLGTVFQTYDSSVYVDPLTGVAGPITAPVKPAAFDPTIDTAKAGKIKTE